MFLSQNLHSTPTLYNFPRTLDNIVRSPTRAAMPVGRRMTPTAAMAAPTNSRLLNNHFPVLAVNKQRQERSPDKEDDLHDPQRKGSLQHRAGLVDLQRQRVVHLPAVLAKGAEGHPNRAAVPVRAVGIGDEAQLVDAGDEGAEEAHVDEGDEEG